MSNQIYRNTNERYLDDDVNLLNFNARIWVQLAGKLSSLGGSIFDANTLIVSKTLSRNTWYKVKTGNTAALNEFYGEASAEYTVKNSEDWTFDDTTGNLTCAKKGKYTIVYNMTIRKTSSSGTAVIFCAIGGNDNPPNQSLAGGTSAGTSDYIGMGGCCIDTVVNDGDTRALWVRFQSATSNYFLEIGALNLLFSPVKAG